MINTNGELYLKVSAIVPLVNYTKNNYAISNKEIKPLYSIINPEIHKSATNNIIAFYNPNISFRSKNLQSYFENSGQSYIEYLKDVHLWNQLMDHFHSNH